VHHHDGLLHQRTERLLPIFDGEDLGFSHNQGASRSHDLAAGNQFLARRFLPALNERFTVAARSSVDAHRKGAWNLKEVLNWEELRVVGKDWTVAWKGRWFQIDAEHQRLSLVDRKVVVRKLRSGTIQVLYQGKKLRWKELLTRAARVPAPGCATIFL